MSATHDLEAIDARLSRDLQRYRAAPSAVRRARVLARIEREGRRPAEGRALRWAAGLAAAGLLLALALGLVEPRRPAAIDGDTVARQVPAPAACAGSGWAGLVRAGGMLQAGSLIQAGGADLRVSLDEPLLAEARRLADDGARVAAALLQRLPGPLRHAIHGSGGG